MIAKTAAVLALSLLAPLSASAAVVTLDFETPTAFSSIDTHYAGGTDSNGVAGANVGVAFGLDVLALPASDAVGTYFSNAPSGVGAMTVVGTSAAMNVAAGFLELAFYYSTLTSVADAVQVWSGADGTGTLLGSLSLTANGCTGDTLCNWTLASLSGFSERAYSVSFAGAANTAVFDDVSAIIPTPATAWLAGLGLLGVAASRRR